MTSHTEKFQKRRLAVENVITAISMIIIPTLAFNIFDTFKKDSLFDYTKLAHLAVLYILSEDITINFDNVNDLAKINPRAFIYIR